ncbi:hypothetical protein GCM10009566_27870 [Streptomyces murinus]
MGPLLTGPGGVLMSPGDRGESTATIQPRLPSVSAWASKEVRSFSRVPSAAHFHSRLWAHFREPKYSGRSVHGVPGRYVKAMASITCRRSRVRSGSNGSILAHWASVNDTHQPTIR